MGEGINHRRREGRDRTDMGRFSHALRAYRMVRAWRDGMVGFPMRCLDGRGQEVVHERITHQIALSVEGHLLAHRNRKALG